MSDTRILAGALLRGDGRVERHLLVKAGPDAGRRLPLGATQTLGRGRDADLRLTDPAASRLHARITLSEGRIVLTDLRSKNGIQINGRRCRGARPLAVGDDVAIGLSRLTLEPGLLDEGERAADSAAPAGITAEQTRSAWGFRTLLAGAVLVCAAAMLLALP